MNKVSIIYWSGTGNTAMMAAAIAEGVKEAGAEVELITADAANAGMIADVKAVALGCPSMGAEQLEETVMEPLMLALDNVIAKKTVALFGSYGWGNGEWMQDWENRILADGATIVNGEGLIVNSTPGEDCLATCKEIGRTLANVQ